MAPSSWPTAGSTRHGRWSTGWRRWTPSRTAHHPGPQPAPAGRAGRTVDVPGVEVVNNDRNLGYAAGMNVGLRRARELGVEAVLTLTHEARVDGRASRRWPTRWRRRRPGGGGAGPEDAGGRAVVGGHGDPRARGAAHASARPGAGAGQAGPCESLDGSVVLWRAAHVEELGGFDARFFMYYEEIDLCARARARGWDVAVLGGVEAISVSGGTNRRVAHAYLTTRNGLAYARRRGGGSSCAGGGPGGLVLGLDAQARRPPLPGSGGAASRPGLPARRDPGGRGLPARPLGRPASGAAPRLRHRRHSASAASSGRRPRERAVTTMQAPEQAPARVRHQREPEHAEEPRPTRRRTARTASASRRAGTAWRRSWPRRCPRRAQRRQGRAGGWTARRFATRPSDPSRSTCRSEPRCSPAVVATITPHGPHRKAADHGQRDVDGQAQERVVAVQLGSAAPAGDRAAGAGDQVDGVAEAEQTTICEVVVYDGPSHASMQR